MHNNAPKGTFLERLLKYATSRKDLLNKLLEKEQSSSLKENSRFMTDLQAKIEEIDNLLRFIADE